VLYHYKYLLSLLSKSRKCMNLSITHNFGER
jgi:hypothetical protein